MKRVLFTGGTGFIGRNVVPILREEHTVYAPTRQELDLKDEDSFAGFVKDHQIDVIVHAANPNPFKNPSEDGAESMFEDSMRVFMNVYASRASVEKVLYLGSGAEFDKTKEIVRLSEDDGIRSLPVDGYGLAKCIMNEMARSSGNVYNLRVFACYGPGDHETKFITHCIRCVMKNEPITIRQDCRFDYLHVDDLANAIRFAIEGNLKHHDYNVASGNSFLLSEIAEIVRRQMGSAVPIVVSAPGMNKEYTASIDRLLEEIDVPFPQIGLEEGIERQVESERKAFHG